MMHRTFPAIVMLLMRLPVTGQGETADVTDNLTPGHRHQRSRVSHAGKRPGARDHFPDYKLCECPPA